MRPTTISKRRERPSPSMAGRSALAVLLALALAGPVQLSYAADASEAPSAAPPESAEGVSPEQSNAESEQASPPSSLNEDGVAEKSDDVVPQEPATVSSEGGSEEGSGPAKAVATAASGMGEIRLSQASIDAGVDADNYLFQEDVTLMVIYHPDPSASGRWFEIEIPYEFTMTAWPESLESATVQRVVSSEPYSEKLLVTLNDDVSLDTIFDIKLRVRDIELYQKASQADVVSPFAINSYTAQGATTPVESSTFEMKTKKLPAPGYTVSVKNPSLTADAVKGSSGSANVEYTLDLSKRKLTATDADFALAVPKQLKTSSGDVFDLDAVVNVSFGGNPQLVGEDQDHFYYKPDKYESSFNPAYRGDKSVSYQLRYHSDRAYSNEVYLSDLDIVSARDDSTVDWSAGKTLKLDTAVSGRKINASWDSAHFQQQARTGEKDVKASVTCYVAPPDHIASVLWMKEAEVIYTITDEVILKSGQPDGDGVDWNYETNLGRQIEAAEIPSLSPDGEWVVKAIYRGPVGGSRYETESGFVVDVRTAYADGSPLGASAYYGVTASGTSEPEASHASLNLQQSIRVASDDLSFIDWQGESQPIIGESDQTVAQYTLKGSNSTMLYQNARLAIDDPAVLGVCDMIRMTRGSNKQLVEYATSSGATGSIRVADIGGLIDEVEVPIPLAEGEYLTGLAIDFGTLDGINLSYDVKLKSSSRVPATLPSDGTDLEGRVFSTGATFSADGAPDRSWAAGTKFVRASSEQIMNVADSSASTFSPDDMPKWLGSYDEKRNAVVGKVELAAGTGKKQYWNMSIDFAGTDSRLLSLVKKIDTGGNGFRFKCVYTTNLHSEEREAGGNSLTVDLTGVLSENEYLTSLRLVPTDKYYDAYSACTVSLITTPDGDTYPHRFFSGEEFPATAASCRIVATCSADDLPAYERQGASVSFSSKATAYLTGNEFEGFTSSYKVYQGDSFTCTVRAQPSVTYGGEYQIKNPVYYFRVDSSYSFQDSTFKATGGSAISFGDPEVTTHVASDGSTIVKVVLPDYVLDSVGTKSDSRTDTLTRFQFDLRAAPWATPGSGYTPVSEVWTDFNESTGEPEAGYSPVVLQNTVPDDTGDLGLPGGTQLHLSSPYRANFQILEATEVGANSLASADATASVDVEGHDNDPFGQRLSIVSHIDHPTKDWVVYVPVPKEGSIVKYQAQDGSGLVTKESSPSACSLSLTGPVSNAGDGAIVTYSTDAAPAYDLTGAFVGTYVDASAVSDWSAVTMIRIEIPELAPREKRFPVIGYESELKAEVGDLIAYGGIYYNFKMGDSADWYKGSGGYGALNSYTLIDFHATGYAWSQPAASTLADPAAPVEERTPLAGAKVSTTNAVTGEELSAVTAEDGTYDLAVPSHGAYALEVAKEPARRYELVASGDPADPDSSKFDPATAQTAVSFERFDVRHVNAGFVDLGPISDPTELPVTGGAGAAPFAAAGIALMAGAALALRLRRNRLPRSR
ncbi:carboxypeptidase-like regulatory domain-containing protein [Raoultibacter phocaeensis]|uniref:carboxypeptidase-like regulatory domain-containing protein n=1 Tax=Raoultibacter phocaeensis TaxID=2479841 RepID=UPI0015D5FA08|nr:carboxypeptidase-like regulatory domain-containing protein [Raoultibacter phocaeensis]